MVVVGAEVDRVEVVVVCAVVNSSDVVRSEGTHGECRLRGDSRLQSVAVDALNRVIRVKLNCARRLSELHVVLELARATWSTMIAANLRHCPHFAALRVAPLRQHLLQQIFPAALIIGVLKVKIPEVVDLPGEVVPAHLAAEVGEGWNSHEVRIG